MSDLQAEMELQQRYDDLRQAHDRTLRKLEQARVNREELVAAVYQAATDAARALALKPVPKPKVDKRKKTPETAVAVLSDWQLSKTTPTYDSDVCEARIELYAEKIADLVEIQRADHPVNELRVWMLGDIIESELIFPGQTHLIDSSLYRQITVDGPRIAVTFLRHMLTLFDTIHVTAVIGNHGKLAGRSSRDQNPETNGDRMLYRICQQILANEPRITWNIPDGHSERNWYAIDQIGSYRSLLIHGDQFRGSSGMPWYGIQKKVGGWKMGAIEHDFDDVMFGHYHQPTRLTLNRVTARCSGSTESHNDYAMEQLAAVGQPSQWLLFVHPERGVTAEYVVWLNEDMP